MSITENIKKIRTAVLGKDVRSAIADSIEECYKDATTKDNANIKRVVTDKYSIDRYTTTYLTDLCRYDNIVVELIKNNKICYSDNLSGTEFEQIRKERGVY